MQHVLTLNSGSSSIKFAVFEAAPELVKCMRGRVEGLGAVLRLTTAKPGEPQIERALSKTQACDHASAMSVRDVDDMLYRQSGLKGLSGISHDMRQLEAAGAPEAMQAIEYFVARIPRELDGARNRASEMIASSDRSRVGVFVIQTTEELMIARHTARLLASERCVSWPQSKQSISAAEVTASNQGVADHGTVLQP